MLGMNRAIGSESKAYTSSAEFMLHADAQSPRANNGRFTSQKATLWRQPMPCTLHTGTFGGEPAKWSLVAGKCVHFRAKLGEEMFPLDFKEKTAKFLGKQRLFVDVDSGPRGCVLDRNQLRWRINVAMQARWFAIPSW